MEELEKKAKAYDDVKEKIAQRFGSNVAEEIFSEYEMNEDEKIRKAIINILNEIVVELNYKEYLNIFYNIKDMVAWLEKQGQKPIEITWKPSEEQMKVLDEVLNFAANHESPYWNNYIFETLNNLIRQLKN